MRRRWLIAGAAALVIVFFAGVYAWMQSPVTNKGQSVQGETQDVLGSHIELVPLNTAYFSTNIPQFLQQKTSVEDASAAVSGMYLFKHKQLDLSDQLGITTGALNGSSLSELSGVKVRQSEPERYHSTVVQGMPEGAIAFERTDEYEVAVFWQHNNRYVSVAVSGSVSRKGQLDATMDAVLGNWQWH